MIFGVTIQQPPVPPLPAGWYQDPSGVVRWWDGQQWTQHVQGAPMMQQPVPVQPMVRQSMDRSQYVRPQQGHSLLLHLFFGGFLLWIPSIYYAISPNHYYHL